MKLHPAPTSRRDRLALAETCNVDDLMSDLTVNPDGSLTAGFISLGPKVYAERVAQRLGQKIGCIVERVRRNGRIPNPVTGEINTLYVISYRRRQ
jgi:hypothetical protein